MFAWAGGRTTETVASEETESLESEKTAADHDKGQRLEEESTASENAVGVRQIETGSLASEQAVAEEENRMDQAAVESEKAVTAHVMSEELRASLTASLTPAPSYTTASTKTIM